MRWMYVIILVVIIGVIGIFAFQNSESVTLQFFNQSIGCPLALLVGVVYLLGMVSGWTVVGFIQRSFRRATESEQR